jgi:hypothetical protein
MPIRVVSAYVVGAWAYGFHRGWKGNICYLVNRAPVETYTDRATAGMVTAVMMQWMAPVCLVYAIRRTEKRVRKMKIEEEDWYF